MNFAIKGLECSILSNALYLYTAQLYNVAFLHIALKEPEPALPYLFDFVVFSQTAKGMLEDTSLYLEDLKTLLGYDLPDDFKKRIENFPL